MSAVSVVIPCLNEAAHIEQLLDAIRDQHCPPLEVIVVDGGSTDATQEVLARYARANPGFPLRVLSRTEGGIAASMNAGIAAALGDVIVRLDGHSRPRPGYLGRLVGTLTASGAGVVGGRWDILPGAPTRVGGAIALAAAHPLGAGDAAYRTHPGTPDAPFEVDTVPFGCFDRSLWATLGGYDETLLTNEDYDFNFRARQRGRRVLLDPSISCTYFARRGFGPLARQYFRYGWWKVQMLKRFPSAVRPRQLVPIAFVLSLAALAIGSLALRAVRPWFGALLAAYVLTVVGASVVEASRRRAWSNVFLLPAAFTVMHVAWGGGAATNLFTFGQWPRWR